MGRKLGDYAPLGEGELGPKLTRCGQGWGLPACQVSSWFVQLFGHNTPTSQTGQTDRTGQERQWSDSIRWTVLQTVAQTFTTNTPQKTFCMKLLNRHTGHYNILHLQLQQGTSNRNILTPFVTIRSTTVLSDSVWRQVSTVVFYTNTCMYQHLSHHCNSVYLTNHGPSQSALSDVLLLSELYGKTQNTCQESVITLL